MKPESINALNWMAVISLVIGGMIVSLSGSILLYLVAAVLSLISVIFGTKRRRIAGMVILVISIILLFITYPRFAQDIKIWKEHIKNDSLEMQRGEEFFNKSISITEGNKGIITRDGTIKQEKAENMGRWWEK